MGSDVSLARASRMRRRAAGSPTPDASLRKMKPPRQARRKQVSVILVCLLACLQLPEARTSALQPDYQISAQVGELARLPCTIGNPTFCGDPYLVAWYKLNASTWQRVSPRAKHSSHQANCELPAPAGNGKPQRQFKCTSIALEPVESADEGQYKCEVTYNEALDSDRCPPATVSALSVVALPSEPEIRLNGRPVSDEQPGPSLREGAQVRLECQSAGGKPAPRIEWLNVSESRAGGPEVALLGARWPQKRSNQLQAASGQPLSSAAVSVALSRHDLNVRFACLVQVAGVELTLERLAGPIAPPGAMLRWLKLDVQVRPRSVQVSVFKLELSGSSSLIEPVGRDQAHELEPNQLYAVQCLVAGSRPRSQLTWFNRSEPVGLEPVELEAELSELAAWARQQRAQPRLSSFQRTISHPDGTFSTQATLLLKTSLWDAPTEELVCKPSNEAFELEDLIQVAPIVSARLSVNYAPLALLEPLVPATGAELAAGGNLLQVQEGRPLVLRCTVLANPVPRNTILQVEWSHRGRKLAATLPPQTVGQQAAAKGPLIERANHVHMPQGSAGSRLLHASKLTVGSARPSDAGAYACHFRLVPAPTGSGGGGGHSDAPQPASGLSQQQQQQQQPRITSGQANRTIQVQVIEASVGAPTLRFRSPSAGLFVYGPRSSVRHLTVVLPATSNTEVSLWCDTGAPQDQDREPKAAQVQRIVWYHNNLQLHSDAHSSTYNLSFRLGALEGGGVGTYRCAQQYVQGGPVPGGFQASQLRFQESRNQVELRVLAGPRLLQPPPAAPPDQVMRVGWRGLGRRELLARPEASLELACSALCEPLCAIDWLLDGRLIERAPSGGRVRVPGGPRADLGLHAWEALSGRHNESAGPAWRLQTRLGSQTSVGLAHQTDDPIANVHSRLELSYRQLALLFGLSAPGGTANQLHPRHQLPLRCQVNASEPFAGPASRFGHAHLAAHTWFPAPPGAAQAATEQLDNELGSDLLEQPVNSTRAAAVDEHLAAGPWWSQAAGAFEPLAAGPPDEMQINLLLDGPPREVSVALSGRPSSAPGSGASLTEEQLPGLLPGEQSPQQQVPMLTCAAASHPRSKLRWSFVHLNGTRHQLPGGPFEGAQLNLRHLLERVVGPDYGATNQLTLVATLLGNYTCTASNEFGSSSGSLALGFQGRPICSLTLEAARPAAPGQLRCAVYSDPPLLETVWFMDNQQVALNRSDARLVRGNERLWFVDLPVAEEDAARSSFRCIARNPLGYSATCELGPPAERNLIGAAQSPPSADIAPGHTAPPASMITIAADVKQANPIRLLDGSAANPGGLQQVAGAALGGQTGADASPALSLLRSLVARVDWLLLAGCLLTLGWLLFLLGSSVARRRLTAAGHLHSKHQAGDTSWSFSSARCGSRGPLPASGADPRLTARSASFLKPCQPPTNYYGSSNADSERDMVQSCSQLSHYEPDYGTQPAPPTCNQLPPNATTHRHLLAQPIYFNAPPALASTLMRRTKQPSALGPAGSSTLAPSSYLKSPGVDPTGANNKQLTGPLINGTHNSRINIDHQPRPQNLNQFGMRDRRGDAHIYDRVIYSQMIL